MTDGQLSHASPYPSPSAFAWLAFAVLGQLSLESGTPSLSPSATIATVNVRLAFAVSTPSLAVTLAVCAPLASAHPPGTENDHAPVVADAVVMPLLLPIWTVIVSPCSAVPVIVGVDETVAAFAGALMVTNVPTTSGVPAVPLRVGVPEPLVNQVLSSVRVEPLLDVPPHSPKAVPVSDPMSGSSTALRAASRSTTFTRIVR